MALLTEGLFIFDRFCNLSTSVSYNSMPSSAYLRRGLIKNKGGLGSFQISQKERLFYVLYQPIYNLAVWSPFASLLHPSKKGLSFPFSLGKKRIFRKLLAFRVFKIFSYSIHGRKCFCGFNLIFIFGKHSLYSERKIWRNLL